MTVSAAPLAEPIPFAFSGRKARNRFCKAATTERMSTWNPADRTECGVPTADIVRLFARFGQGEPGLIVTGAITVDPAYLEAPGNSIIPSDAPHQGERFNGFVALASAAKAHGSLILGQLNHTGRQTMAMLQSDPVSASDVQLQENDMDLQYNKPHAASNAEITAIVSSFANAAAYLEAAGFDGIQLNAAHGYLISQFLSPRTNRRSDKYGGSLENRARLLLDVVHAIRLRCGRQLVLSVKLNCVEYQPEGITPDEVKTVCSWLEAARTDIIELSGGTYEEFGWKHKAGHTSENREGYFLDAADAIRPALTKTRLYATGGFFTVPAMLEALEIVDGIGMARAICQEPELCKKIIGGESEGRAVQLLDQSNYSLTAMMAGSQMRQMSLGEEPIDGGRQDVVDEFQRSLQRWILDMTTGNPDGKKFGWMEVPRQAK